jgi:ribosomal protein S27AE
MPDKSVQTIRDLIYYQYAKVIARSAFKASDGKEAKKQHYGFIKKTLRELQSCVKTWSEITREDWQMIEKGKECAYCGTTVLDLQREHIVPRSLEIKPECSTCGHIQEIHNQVWACENCNHSKLASGLYEFYKKLYPDEKKYYDMIPPLLEKKYLKTIYNCHGCAGTLDKGDIDGDGVMTVLDIDYILRAH